MARPNRWLRFIWVGVLVLSGAVSWPGVLRGAVAGGQRPGGGSSPADTKTQSAGGPLEVIQVQPNFYMVAGAGGNVAVQTGPDGSLIVDTGNSRSAETLIATIRSITNRPIRYIINTGFDPDHVGGNERLSAAGLPIGGAGGGGGGGVRGMIERNPGAPIIASEVVLLRMGREGSDTAFPGPAWPTETFTDTKDLYFDREAIQVFHEPAAHADGDAIVFFRRSDVLVVGDLVDTRAFPSINLSKGGSVQGLIAALNHIIDLAVPPIPFAWQEGGTQIVPGHGRLCEEADVVEYRDMVTIVRDVVQSLIGKGMTLNQIKAARPALGYERRYGATEGAATADMFVEAVYQSLLKERK